MEDERGRPEFLAPEITTRHLTSRVVSIENIPKSIREKFPHGFVIKKIDDDPDALAAKFGPEYIVAPTLEPRAIIDAFANRQDFYDEYFGDKLPRFVVKSDFVIERAKSHTQKPRLFEIQPRLFGYINLGYWALPDALQKIATRFTKEQIRSIREELQIVVDKIRTLIVRHKKVPDLFSGENMVISQDGELRCIDTNELWDAEEKANIDGQEIIKDSNEKMNTGERLRLYDDLIHRLMALEK